MKKLISLFLALVMVLSIMCGLVACGDRPYSNKQLFDFTYSFDTAIISLPDGTIVKGKVDSWTDYEDGDQIQVVINGTTYLVHSTNVALMKK